MLKNWLWRKARERERERDEGDEDDRNRDDVQKALQKVELDCLLPQQKGGFRRHTDCVLLLQRCSDDFRKKGTDRGDAFDAFNQPVTLLACSR